MIRKLCVALFVLAVGVYAACQNGSPSAPGGADERALGLSAEDGTCFGKQPTITCTGGPCLGTEGEDVILGSAIADTIDALGGDDRVCGEEGDDEIIGQLGDDSVLGNEGNDNIYGGYDEGDFGGVEGETDGQDRLLGGPGDDVISGGEEQDRLEGGPGEDDLNGDGGNDKIYGHSGADNLDGGDGTDLCSGGSGGVNTYVNCEIARGTGAPDSCFDRVVSIQCSGGTCNGSGDDDVIRGTSIADTIDAFGGNDRICGLGDDDELFGGANSDKINGGGGTDTCIGETEVNCEDDPIP